MALVGSRDGPAGRAPGNMKDNHACINTLKNEGRSVTNIPARVFALITCLSALPLVVGLTGCAGNHSNQSPGGTLDGNRTAEGGNDPSIDQRIEDSRTGERVREALAAGADYRYDGVKVEVAKGVVQLSGLVNTSASPARAARSRRCRKT